MSDDDLIFKKRPATDEPSEPAPARPTERFTIIFRIVNNRIDYVTEGLRSMGPTWMLHFLREGVTTFAVEKRDFNPRVEVMSSGARVRMEHSICFDWSKEIVYTSLLPEDGPLFQSVVNYVATMLYGEAEKQKNTPVGSA